MGVWAAPLSSQGLLLQPVPAPSTLCCSACLRHGAGSTRPAGVCTSCPGTRDLQTVMEGKEWGMFMFLLSVVAALLEPLWASSLDMQNWFCFLLVFLQYGQLVLSFYFCLDLTMPFELSKWCSRYYTIHSLMVSICFASKCKEDEWEEFQTQQKVWVLIWIFLTVYPNSFCICPFSLQPFEHIKLSLWSETLFKWGLQVHMWLFSINNYKIVK